MKASLIEQKTPHRFTLGFSSQDLVIGTSIVLAFVYALAFVINIDKAWFEAVLNIVTHVAALPAFLTEHQLSAQIGITTLVSVAYHVVAAVDDQSDLYHPLEQLDVGMSVALISAVLLVYMDGKTHAPLTFIAVTAASFPQLNVIITGIVILVGYPITTLVTYTSNNGSTMDKYVLFALQIISVVAFLLSDHYTFYSLHPIWHVTSLFSIYYMILIRSDMTQPKQKQRYFNDPPIQYRF